ncbi:MAG: sensor histidine kinase [Acutalibacteraceae bacterium]|nr:sensor histidine kinase [Acutalibacteraceae bacterium]
MKKKEWQILLSYIRAHIGVALFLAGSAAVFAVVLFLSGLPAEPVRYAALLCAVGGVVCALPGYLQYRRRYRAAELALQGLPEAVDRLCAPLGAVEEAYDAALRRLCAMLAKSETDRQRQRIENADYFTMWIHQIKTPIAAMQLILREQDDARSRELLAELFRIDQYAEMALTYARLESPTTDLVLRRCAVEPIVRSVVRQYAGQFVRRHVALRCEIEPVCALTDEKWLAFILGQLLSNAVKYTENGTVTVRVTKELVLSVSDTGIGIAPEDLPRIFEKGFTGYNGRAGRKSTGLGMYLSRCAAEKLGHRISVQSAPGQGTTVSVDLRSVDLGVE